jgi:hypothetical protein
MPTPTYTLIASSTVGSGGASSIDFSSIPSTYTDLLLKLSIRSANTAGSWDPVRIKFNTSSSNITNRNLYGTGSAAGSEVPTGSEANIFNYTSNANNTANTFGSLEIYIPNYTSTSSAKSGSSDGVGENNATASITALNAILWNPGTQAAVTAIGIVPYSGGGTFVQYSTAYLYGIIKS